MYADIYITMFIWISRLSILHFSNRKKITEVNVFYHIVSQLINTAPFILVTIYKCFCVFKASYFILGICHG